MVTKIQKGVLSDGSPAAIGLVYRFRAGTLPHSLRSAVSQGLKLEKQIQKKNAAARFEVVFGFGSQAWSNLRPGKMPSELHDFREIRSGQFHAPATGGDLWVHIKSKRQDLCFEFARSFHDVARADAEVLDEVHGFQFLDVRDLTGFKDGTQNPRGRERQSSTLISKSTTPEDAAFAGGSYAFVQRFVHAMPRWTALDTQEQEQIIGRTKKDSKELRNAALNSHIKRAEIHHDGEELKIHRQGVPYGRVSGESGLLFIAYTCQLSRIERMLTRMMGGEGDGQHDRLMEFTRPVTGAFFFVPALSLLQKVIKA